MRSLLTILYGIVVILTPGLQDTGTPPVDTFVTLAESTTFGPGGTIFDYSTRVVAPKEIVPPGPKVVDSASVTNVSTGGVPVSCKPGVRITTMP